MTMMCILVHKTIRGEECRSAAVYTVASCGLSRLGLVELDHGQLTAPHDVTSTSSTDELAFPRRTVAEMMDPVILAAANTSTFRNSTSASLF